MSARRERDIAESSGASGEGNSGLMIAESTRVPDLPGVIAKKVILGPDEIGFVNADDTGGDIVEDRFNIAPAFIQAHIGFPELIIGLF